MLYTTNVAEYVNPQHKLNTVTGFRS